MQLEASQIKNKESATSGLCMFCASSRCNYWRAHEVDVDSSLLIIAFRLYRINNVEGFIAKAGRQTKQQITTACCGNSLFSFVPLHCTLNAHYVMTKSFNAKICFSAKTYSIVCNRGLVIRLIMCIVRVELLFIFARSRYSKKLTIVIQCV